MFLDLESLFRWLHGLILFVIRFMLLCAITLAPSFVFANVASSFKRWWIWHALNQWEFSLNSLRRGATGCWACRISRSWSTPSSKINPIEDQNTTILIFYRIYFRYLVLEAMFSAIVCVCSDYIRFLWSSVYTTI